MNYNKCQMSPTASLSGGFHLRLKKKTIWKIKDVTFLGLMRLNNGCILWGVVK